MINKTLVVVLLVLVLFGCTKENSNSTNSFYQVEYVYEKNNEGIFIKNIIATRQRVRSRIQSIDDIHSEFAREEILEFIKEFTLIDKNESYAIPIETQNYIFQNQEKIFDRANRDLRSDFIIFLNRFVENPKYFPFNIVKVVFED